MTGVSLRGVTKRYGEAAVLDNVSFEVADGEFLVLLGPSGSGKSTLLKLIAGIDSPDAGEIWLGDRRIDRLLPRFRDVAMVFQSYALYPHMTVAANLAFPLRSTGVDRTEARRRVAETAEMLGLDGLLRRRPAQLSGGQQQRVALGRAIVRRPRLFLMDEPLSNLDAKLRARTRLDLTRLHERLGITTIYVTHDQVEAMTMGQRIGVIDAGRLHQLASPETTYEDPADLFVADFLGSPAINTLRMTVRWQAGEVDLEAHDIHLRFPTSAMRGLAAEVAAEGSEVIAAIRPENLRLGHDLPPAQLLVMTVDRVELLGHERLVHVHRGDVTLSIRAGLDVHVCPGETVDVGFLAAGMRLFDPESGRALATLAAVPAIAGGAS